MANLSKKKIKEEESVDDPLYIQEERIRSENDNICTELKVEGIDDYNLFVQEIHNSGDEENNSVVGDIDIVQHKIKIDEIKVEESVDYPPSIHQETENSKDIKEDINEEENVALPSFNHHELGNVLLD